MVPLRSSRTWLRQGLNEALTEFLIDQGILSLHQLGFSQLLKTYAFASDRIPFVILREWLYWLASGGAVRGHTPVPCFWSPWVRSVSLYCECQLMISCHPSEGLRSTRSFQISSNKVLIMSVLHNPLSSDYKNNLPHVKTTMYKWTDFP